MPDFFLFGGPNGAGKTTIALRLLRDVGVREFVNADSIAAGLSPLNRESVALQAGALMIVATARVARPWRKFRDGKHTGSTGIRAVHPL